MESLDNDLRQKRAPQFYMSNRHANYCFVNTTPFASKYPDVLTNFDFKYQFVINKFLTPEVQKGGMKKINAFHFGGVRGNPLIKNLTYEYFPYVTPEPICVGSGSLR
jgi:hypothetical protein